MKINYKKIKQKYLKSYNQNGVILIKSLFEKKDIKNIKDELIEYIKLISNKLSKRQINLIKNTKLINSLHDLKKCKIVNKILRHKKIKTLSKDFVGEDAKEFGAELFAKPKKIGLPSPAHQDNYYWNINKNNGITIWIALDNSNSYNGGVYYYLKSHKIGIQPHKPSNAPGSSQTIKYPNVLKFFKKKIPKLNIGDVLIHQSAIIHGSNKNTSNNTRMGLTLRFIPKKSKVDYFLKKKYETELKKQI